MQACLLACCTASAKGGSADTCSRPALQHGCSAARGHLASSTTVITVFVAPSNNTPSGWFCCGYCCCDCCCPCASVVVPAVAAALSIMVAGTLPSAWSALRNVTYVGLEENPGITGTIPTSFAGAAGSFYNLYETSISGCRPRGMPGTFLTWQQLPNGTFVTRQLPLCN